MIRIIIGTFIVLFGVSLLFDQLGLHTILGFSIESLIDRYWPLLLVVLGIFAIQKGSISSGIMLSIAGIVFLASSVFLFNAWEIVWPILIIGIGIITLTKKPDVKVIEAVEANDKVDVTAVFWGIEEKITSKLFRGGSVTAIFGGVEFDLREAVMAREGGTLEVTAIFGGVEITVPPTMGVVVRGEGTFGGWENHYTTVSDQDAPTLIITGNAIFGGVEVKN